jgi:hypothetical protein
VANPACSAAVVVLLRDQKVVNDDKPCLFTLGGHGSIDWDIHQRYAELVLTVIRLHPFTQTQSGKTTDSVSYRQRYS